VRNRVALRWARNPWLATLLLVALATRLLVPMGYMPGQGGLMLCPGYAPLASTHGAQRHDMPGMDTSIDMSDGAMPMTQGGKAPSHDGMVLCLFAAAAAALASFHAPTVTAFAPAVPVEIPLLAQAFIPATQVAPTRLPRGPPAPV